MRSTLVRLFAGAAFAAAGLVSADADACGGCFPPQPPPGEQQSIVTDHRMVLAVSQTQSTLYDQIQYSGTPSEFAWVLPISGTVDVGLSADSLFTALNDVSAVVVQEPPRNCPAPPSCPQDEDAEGAAAGADAGASFDAPKAGVTVIKTEVVGPYFTQQIRSDDPEKPQALIDWLTENQYTIPDDIKPVIAEYVTEKFNFLVMKLKPGAGVSAMRPVRVKIGQGAYPNLPLRMVAAGTGATVGITLWVIAEGRYEPQNFQFFSVKNEDLTWNWSTGASDFKDVRATRASADPGKTWEIESSFQTYRQTIENTTRQIGLSNAFGPDAGATSSDYVDERNDNGVVTKLADAVRDDDFAELFAGIPDGQEHLTRLRADLGRVGLASDLVLVASQDQSALPQVRVPTHELGQPTCPIYNGCSSAGELPRDQAVAHANQQAASSKGGTFACQTTARASFGGYGALGTFIALAAARARRRRTER